MNNHQMNDNISQFQPESIEHFEQSPAAQSPLIDAYLNVAEKRSSLRTINPKQSSDSAQAELPQLTFADSDSQKDSQHTGGLKSVEGTEQVKDLNSNCVHNLLFDSLLDTAFDTSYDPQIIGDRAAIEAEFACNIKSNEEAIVIMQDIFEQSTDPYDHAFSAVEVQELMAKKSGQYGGIGTSSSGEKDGFKTILEVYPDSPGEAAGIKTGDLIMKVNGQSLENLSASEGSKLIRGEPGTAVTLTIKRGEQILEKTVTREIVNRPAVIDKELENDIAYLRLYDLLNDNGPSQLQDALSKYSDAEAYILDLRNNGGGYIDNAYEIAGMMLGEGEVVEIKQRAGEEGGNPTYLKETVSIDNTDPANRKIEVSTIHQGAAQNSVGPTIIQEQDAPADMIGDKPLVILVNEHTASAAEIITGALSDSDNAYVIGEQTFGKGIGQTMFREPEGTAVKVTSLHYFTPSGKWLGDGNKNRDGIVPDQLVQNADSVTIGSAQDAQLAAAITYLNSRINGQSPVAPVHQP